MDFKVFSILWSFFFTNQFFTSMPKATMEMTLASGSSHTLSSLHVFPLLHSYLTFTVIRFVWVSAKFGTCTVVRVNGTLIDDNMRRFKGEFAHFNFNNCLIYAHDGASAKFSTNSHETDNSVPVNLKVFFSVLFFYKRTSFSLSCLKSLFPDFSLWFFPHIVFSAGVSLLHSYLTFLWTSRSLPWFVCFSTRTSFSLPC